jgi:hypothetical protein
LTTTAKSSSWIPSATGSACTAADTDGAGEP